MWCRVHKDVARLHRLWRGRSSRRWGRCSTQIMSPLKLSRFPRVQRAILYPPPPLLQLSHNADRPCWPSEACTSDARTRLYLDTLNQVQYQTTNVVQLPSLHLCLDRQIPKPVSHGLLNYKLNNANNESLMELLKTKMSMDDKWDQRKLQLCPWQWSRVHLVVKGDHIRKRPNRNYFIICRYIVKFLSSGCAGARNEHSRRRMIALLSNLSFFFVSSVPRHLVGRKKKKEGKKAACSALNLKLL